MPVITPAYPSMCSTHNVTSSTQSVTTDEFESAADMLDKITTGSESWTALFKKHDFFHKYKYYLQVVASSNDAELHLKWSGMVESKIRQLVNKLELVEQVERAHPFIKGFDRISICSNVTDKNNAAHGEVIAIPTPPHTDAETTSSDTMGDEHFPMTLYTTLYYVGLSVRSKDPLNRQLDISWPSNEFMKLVKAWDHYDDADMAISVRCIKLYSFSNAARPYH